MAKYADDDKAYGKIPRKKKKKLPKGQAKGKKNPKIADAKIMILSPNYKKGKDKALDAAIKAIKQDPEMRGSWGIKGSTRI